MSRRPRSASPSLSDLPPEAVPDRILNTRQAAAYRGVSVPQWRRLYKRGDAPPPVRIGLRTYGWRLSVLAAAQAALPVATFPSERKGAK
jgi:predicted DNA-binding transcriptional regulator AlpA